MESTINILISFIEKDLKNHSLNLSPETSLFKGGLLTSLDLVALLDFIEKEFEVAVPSSEVDFENFDTVGAIARYLGSKK